MKAFIRLSLLRLTSVASKHEIGRKPNIDSQDIIRLRGYSTCCCMLVACRSIKDTSILKRYFEFYNIEILL